MQSCVSKVNGFEVAQVKLLVRIDFLLSVLVSGTKIYVLPSEFVLQNNCEHTQYYF